MKSIILHKGDIVMEIFVVVRVYAWYQGSDTEKVPYGHVVSAHVSRKKANKEVKRLDHTSTYREDEHGRTYEFWHDVTKVTLVP